MPKVIEYPKDPFLKVIELAEAVDYLGGNCSLETCAEKLGRTVSGGFTALVSSAVKHGLVESRKGSLTTTTLFKGIKLSYDAEEKRANEINAFLAPPLYRKVYEKFKGRELPNQLLGKILIREFSVEQEIASRIASNFTEGVKLLGLLVDGKLRDITNGIAPSSYNHEETEDIVDNVQENALRNFPSVTPSEPVKVVTNNIYTVHIKGPDIDSRIEINEADDLFIVEAVLRKLRRRFEL